MKSLAAQLLEKMGEDDQAAGAAPADMPPKKKDEPVTDAEPAGGMPGDEALQGAVDSMQDPDSMSEALDMMCDQSDKYMDEDDKETYTAPSDQEMADVKEARSKMREAAMKMRGKKMMK